MDKNKGKIFGGDYKDKGEYHKKLDKKWPYLPIYVEKIRKIDKLMSKYKNAKILDAGCGEGILVEKYRKKGFNITGLDLNYTSKHVKKGDITKMPFKDEEFDVVLCLDVLEHMNLLNQEKAITEISRVVKKNGIVIWGLMNLAHFASRISFLFTGNLLRTSEVERDIKKKGILQGFLNLLEPAKVDRHIGDRPIIEYIEMMKRNNMKVIEKIGFFPTFPIISLLTIKMPSRVIWMHKLYNTIFPFTGICFENIIITRKK